MIVQMNDIIALKNYLAEQQAGKVHVHDTCGGQYFSLEQTNDKTNDSILRFFSGKNVTVLFSDDLQTFRVLPCLTPS
jgi:hypothetical protein